MKPTDLDLCFQSRSGGRESALIFQTIQPASRGGVGTARDSSERRPPPHIRRPGCRCGLVTALIPTLLGTEPASAQFQWVQVAPPPATRPAARVYPGMVYDGVRGVILLHGGEVGQTAPLSDTWAWDGERWARLTQQGPVALGFGLAFDSDRGVAVLHGGLGAGGPPKPIIGLTWEWDGQVWRQVGDGSGPGKRAGSAMAYHPKRQRVFLHGGTLDNPPQAGFSPTPGSGMGPRGRKSPMPTVPRG